MEQLKQAIAEKLQHLIQTDFEQFIFLLYRLDISEKKVKNILLQPAEENTAVSVAALIIERQAEKIRSRAIYRGPAFSGNEDEKW